MEDRLVDLATETVLNTLPYNRESNTGFVHPDFIPKQGHIDVQVKSRECDEKGNRTLWSKIVYLLTGRYSR